MNNVEIDFDSMHNLSNGKCKECGACGEELCCPPTDCNMKGKNIHCKHYLINLQTVFICYQKTRDFIDENKLKYSELWEQVVEYCWEDNVVEVTENVDVLSNGKYCDVCKSCAEELCCTALRCKMTNNHRNCFYYLSDLKTAYICYFKINKFVYNNEEKYATLIEEIKEIWDDNQLCLLERKKELVK